MVVDALLSTDAASAPSDPATGTTGHAAPSATDSASFTLSSPPPPPIPLPDHLGPPEHTTLDSSSVGTQNVGRIPPATAVPNTFADLSMDATLEGDVTVADQTLVEDGPAEEGDTQRNPGHAKGPSSSSLSLVAGGHSKRASVSSVGHAPPPPQIVDDYTDPLRMEHDEEDLTESPMRFENEDEEGKAGPVKRVSHLRVNTNNPPSPMPWEVMTPPLENNNLAALAAHYSPSEPQKFSSQQMASMPRPLIPKSAYYFRPPPPDSAFGTAPVGQIGVHHPREIIRIERDYTGGELIQFAPIYPLELEGRITPTQFLESINAINEVLISAYSLRHSMLDNMLALFTLQLSRLFMKTHFEKTLLRLQRLIEQLNTELFNPVGLNLLWPQNVAFLYLELEYY